MPRCMKWLLCEKWFHTFLQNLLHLLGKLMTTEDDFIAYLNESCRC